MEIRIDGLDISDTIKKGGTYGRKRSGRLAVYAVSGRKRLDVHG